MENPSLVAKADIPLRRHVLIVTHDLAAAQSAVSREIGSHKFTRAAATDDADVRLSCARLPRSRIFGVQLGSNILASSAPFTSLQLVLPLSGYVARLRGNQQPVRPGSALILPPGDPVNLLWASNCTGLVVWVDDNAIDDLMMRVCGYPLAPEVKFHHSVDLGSTAGRSIADALGIIMREGEEQRSLLNRGVTTQAVEELLLTSLVHAAVDDQETASDPPRLHLGSVHMRRALEFIRHHLQDNVTVDQLAAAAGVSLRTLQYEFARQFGVGPITMIRREKLRRVRAALLNPTADGDTIGDTAACWGFFDAKYFAKMYLREFGERPSDTRRRGRG